VDKSYKCDGLVAQTTFIKVTNIEGVVEAKAKATIFVLELFSTSTTVLEDFISDFS